MSAKAQTKTGALLVEARTEELPPQLLGGLANQFPDSLLTNLQKAGFADAESFREKNADGNPKLLATPRRIAALLKNIRRAAPDRALTRRGPQVAAALDKDGKPTKALEGFLRATNSQIGDLRKVTEKDKEYFAADLREEGGTLDGKLAAIVQETLLSLNAPRLMRWGDNDWRFIRPLRGMVMLWETEEIAGEVMGVKAGRTTQGHRFLSDGAVEIESAEEYESAMKKAQVIVDFNVRRTIIADELIRAAEKLDAWVFPDNKASAVLAKQDDSGNLLDLNYFLHYEVAEICENPKIIHGDIAEKFLRLPAKCVGLCMQNHQKFFPLVRKDNSESLNLSPHFLAVADNAPNDLSEIVGGYNRVLSARLADMDFYLQEDGKMSPEESREKLKRIVYHEKLGSQFDRAERIRAIARVFSDMTKELDGVDRAEEVDRAAAICKLDLPTLTVGEHPELAGYVAGICFANNDDRIRKAVEDHERTGILGSDIGEILALANHMEKIVGFFGIGERPTGSKDPFALRRAAANVADALMISYLRCDALVDAAQKCFGNTQLPHFDRKEIHSYIADRLRQNNTILDTGAGTAELNALLSDPPSCFWDIQPKAEALVLFVKMPEAATLIEANKRINNILRKSGVNKEDLPKVNDELFEYEEERQLDLEQFKVAEEAMRMEGAGNPESALLALSSLAAPLAAFFDKVMVNADDEKIRANRFALLAELRALLNQVADISKLAG